MSAVAVHMANTHVTWCPMCEESWTYSDDTDFGLNASTIEEAAQLQVTEIALAVEEALLQHCRESRACAYKIFEVDEDEVLASIN